MKVSLISHTPQPEEVVAAAARLCYSSRSASEIMERFREGEAAEFIRKLVDMGHASPMEHASFTFAIEGVSRVLSHQLVRHRIGASYSQKSQRYVSEKGFAFVTPPSIARDPEAAAAFAAAMEEARAAYEKLAELVPKEDARFVLPNAAETQLVLSMNARSLYHFFALRCCRRAQWEIRALAEAMLAEVQAVAPNLFAGAGAPCVATGFCPEGDFSCGRAPRAEKR